MGPLLGSRGMLGLLLALLHVVGTATVAWGYMSTRSEGRPLAPPRLFRLPKALDDLWGEPFATAVGTRARAPPLPPRSTHHHLHHPTTSGCNEALPPSSELPRAAVAALH